MKKMFFLCFILCLSVVLCLAGETLPVPDKNGDFSVRNLHRYWEVVDTDPQGVNGRLSTEYPIDWLNVSAIWPDEEISKWPIIRKFSRNTILECACGHVGVIVFDEDGKPWLRVLLGGWVCFVRANSKYVHPVEPAGKIPSLSYKIGVIDDPDGYTNMRAGNGIDKEIIEKVNSGEHFLIISSDGDWWKIMTPSCKTGYMHNSKIKIIEGEEAFAVGKIIDSDGYAYLREGPSKGYPVICKVLSGNIVILVKYDSDAFLRKAGPRASIGSWTKVICGNGTRGYMNTAGMEWIPLLNK